MKLDVYFMMAFIVVYGIVDVHYELPEFPLTIAIIPLLWIQVAMTIYFTKRENKLGASAAIVSCILRSLFSFVLAYNWMQMLRVAEIAYLISRILVLNDVPPSLRSKTLLKNEKLLFAGCSLTLATGACLNAALCFLNFDHGLKPLLLDQGWKQGRHEFQPIQAQEQLAVRLELD